MTSLPMNTRCIKYLLFIFNLLFVISGIILISVGATVHGIYGDYKQFLDNGYMSTSAFLVAIGLIIFVISFFGCCGAVKENFCMTVTFSALLVIIFIFELAAGISGYVLRGRTVSILEETLKVNIIHYNNTEHAKTIDLLQRSFKCCGINNYTDWTQLYGDRMTPVSCCTEFGALNNVTCEPGLPGFHTEPCIQAFGDFIEGHALWIGGVALGIAFVQLIGIGFSCHLSKQIKRSYSSV